MTGPKPRAVCAACGRPKTACRCLEDLFVRHLAEEGIPSPERECRFHPTRQWRYDLCWRDRKIAVEIEGGIFVGGKHGRGAGILADIEKGNETTRLGWRLYRFAARQIRGKVAARYLAAVFAEEPS